MNNSIAKADATISVTPYNVTYDGNGSDGGTVPVDYNNYLYKATAKVFANTGNLTKAGSTFAGWHLKKQAII